MTEKNNYWVDFWNNNDIVNKASAHEKVGRTIKGVPIAPEKWQEVLNDLEKHLSIGPNDEILDIGAGSGVISVPFSKKVKRVTALDVSETLLSDLKGIHNIVTLAGDARTMDFDDNSFDKVIIYFALQHFSEEETVNLFKKIFRWLKPGGILFAGDVPDKARLFDFFNTPERQSAYFRSLENQSPIIGTWFSKDFFEPLGAYLGYDTTSVLEQPEQYINAHYRFDVKLVKA